ncbi:MAG: phosphorylase family protein [Phycisphaerales bacterium]
MTITILCAMQPEADTILQMMGLRSINTPWKHTLPPSLWANEDQSITLVTNGFDPRTNANLIGTTPATFATQLVINHLNPELIIVAGAAGGCSKATSIGQTFLIDNAFHHDRRIPLPEFADYAHGPERLHCPTTIDLPHANISTGNALDTLDHELDFFNKHNITIKDMETASIAWTASLYETKTMAIRSITDFYDHPTPENQFLNNFDLALSNLSNTIAEQWAQIESAIVSPAN